MFTSREKYHERKEQWLSKIKEKAKVQEEAALVSTKGAILKLVGLNKDTKFTDIKDELTKYSPVAFVGHVTDDGEVSAVELLLLFTFVMFTKLFSLVLGSFQQ